MAPKTTKAHLAEMLEDLTEHNFERFCHQLLDRKKPSVPRSRVEGKCRRDIADVLVSAFTEAKSVGVAVVILKQIGCRDEAQKLAIVSRGGVKKSGGPTAACGSLKKSGGPTAACRSLKKSGGPTAPRGSLKKSGGPTAPCGSLKKSGGPTAQCKSLKKSGGPTAPRKSLKKSGGPTAPRESLKKSVAHGGVKKPEEVKAEAENRVLSEGGDLSNDRLVLSRYIIQFGEYKGQTFNQLVENDMGYVAKLVNKHQNNRKKSKSPMNPLMANKDSLTEFVTSCPDLMKKVELLTKKDALQPGQKRKACSSTISFGPSAANKRKAPLPAPPHIPTTSFGPSATQNPYGGLENSGAPTAPYGGLEKSGAPTAPYAGLEKSGAPTAPYAGLEKSGVPTAPYAGLEKSGGPTAPCGSLKKSGGPTAACGSLKKSGGPTAPRKSLKKSGGPTAPCGSLKKSGGPTAQCKSLKKSGGPTAPRGSLKTSGGPTAPRGSLKKSGGPTAPRKSLKKSGGPTAQCKSLKKSGGPTAPYAGLEKSGGPTAPGGGLGKSVAHGGVKKPEDEAESKNRVLSEGGDLSNLAFFTSQPGKQIFDWFMENDQFTGL
ncbi:uncharacterized protein LOC114843268 isoform X2 [Betta splendens]|uniref:Uncharacterized protein LOC114843268 isoform X2 n=1 Tax=Betta splendens TaxID=158456 RepID=A0A6P7KXY5_BETSP|nr:uncharacterized protein LOC114843268 isoform X2 [Betta splendens]